MPSRWKPWQCFALLAVAIAVTYFPGLRAPFIFDDEPQLANKPALTNLWPPTEILKMVRPVGYYSFAANISLQGLRPAVLRGTNVLIHFGSACLLFAIARRMLKRGEGKAYVRHATGIALSIALLWAVHPLPTAAVAYIIQRFESLMSFFLLLSLFAFWKGVRTPRTHRAWPWYSVAVIAAWLGAGTKEVMVVAPLIYLFVDRAFLARMWSDVFRRRWPVHLAFSGCWLILYLTHRTQGGDYSTAGFGGQHTATMWEYLRTQPSVILRYLRLVFCPDQLILDYQWPVATSAWQIYGLGSIVVALLLASLWLCFTRPRIGVIAFSFFLLLALTSSFLPISDIAVEYRMYLASAVAIALAVLAGFAILQRIANPAHRDKLAFASVAIVATLLAMRTYARNLDYRDPIRVWLQCAAFNPNNGRAEMNAALRLQQAGRIDEALVHYERATLAKVEMHQGKLHFLYGQLLLDTDQQDAATKQFALSAADPPYRPAERLGLAEGLRATGQPAKAIRQLSWLLQDVPQYDDARIKLVWILATTSDDNVRNPPTAVKQAEKMLTVGENSVALLDAAAAAFAANGDFARAIEFARQAEAKARLQDASFADAIAARRKLYGAGKPYLDVE